MNHLVKSIIKSLVLIIPLCLITSTTSAQEEGAYEKAKIEIVNTFGMFPTMFQVYPDYALPGAWENFKQLGSPDGKISSKHTELLKLAVASQIPCVYCIYFHTEAAKANGATDEEIQEAIAKGAEVRQWSMIIQGNQVDFEEFKAESEAMMKFVMEKSGEK